MKNFNLSLEITMNGENPLDVAKELQKWLHDPENFWEFIVQDSETKEVFSIDLNEDDEDALLPHLNYKPIIET